MHLGRVLVAILNQQWDHAPQSQVIVNEDGVLLFGFRRHLSKLKKSVPVFVIHTYSKQLSFYLELIILNVEGGPVVQLLQSVFEFVLEISELIDAKYLLLA